MGGEKSTEMEVDDPQWQSSYNQKGAMTGDPIVNETPEVVDGWTVVASKRKETVYHSSGMLSNLSSSWTSKPPLAVKYRFEPSSIEQSGGSKSLCSTLERLLAWEKKLYEEVKASIQPDAKQCGFYVLRYMREILHECFSTNKALLRLMFKRGQYTPAQIDEVRLEWAHCIQDHMFE